MNVEELLNKKDLKFRPSGNDYLIECLNPDHDDSNPSMRVDKITGVFHCLACSFAGSIYKHFNINVSMLDNRVLFLKSKIRAMYVDNFIVPKGAEPFVTPFRDISVKTLNHFQAFTHSDYEDRIVFPIRNDSGNIAGFNARHMYSDVNPKYIFDPPGMSLSLYPFDAKPIMDSIILVEGLFDMLNLHDKGLTNAVCTFGTAFGATKKKETQKANINKLLNFKLRGVSKIYIMYDGDLAGRNATLNLLEYLKDDFIVEPVDLEDDVDPGNLTHEDVKSLKEMLYDNA
jgi:DNA primase